MMGLGTDIIMGLLMSVLLSAIITEVYAQTTTPVPPATPSNDTKIIDSKQIIDQIRAQLLNSQLEDYRLYENGTAQ
jgi:hypothetical protein